MRRCDLFSSNASAVDFDALTAQQQRLDHRASGALLLLAFAAGARLAERHASYAYDCGPGTHALPPPSFADIAAAHCATCRVAVQELVLTAELVRHCSPSLKEEEDRERWLELLATTPAILCDHLEALGQLGHTFARLEQLRTPASCARTITKNARALRAGLLRIVADDGAVGHEEELRLRSAACASVCAAGDGGLEGELQGWPAAAQLLLDHDDVGVSLSLASPSNLLAINGSGAAGALLLPARRASGRTRHQAAVRRRRLRACDARAERRQRRSQTSSLALQGPNAKADAGDDDSDDNDDDSGGGGGGGTLAMLKSASRRLLRLQWDVASDTPVAAADAPPLLSELRCWRRERHPPSRRFCSTWRASRCCCGT